MEDKSYCTIYLVRHGLTDWNANHMIQGQSDIPLNKEGEVQAKEAAQHLEKISFDEVYSSDLIRARKTAEIIVLEKKMAVKTTKALRERFFGHFEGKDFLVHGKEVADLLEQYRKKTAKEKPVMETDEQLVGRAIVFLRELAVAYAGKKVLVVSHGSLIRCLLIHLGYGTYETLLPGAIKNLGYVKLDCDGVDFFVKEVNKVEKS